VNQGIVSAKQREESTEAEIARDKIENAKNPDKDCLNQSKRTVRN